MTKEEFTEEFLKLTQKKITKLLLIKRDMMQQAIEEKLENQITLKNIAIVDLQLQMVEIDQAIFHYNQGDFDELKEYMEKNPMPKNTNPDIN
jgi:hypothetical protein